MRKHSFENLRPNHKWAFIDGLLCGLSVSFFYWLAKRD